MEVNSVQTSAIGQTYGEMTKPGIVKEQVPQATLEVTDSVVFSEEARVAAASEQNREAQTPPIRRMETAQEEAQAPRAVTPKHVAQKYSETS